MTGGSDRKSQSIRTDTEAMIALVRAQRRLEDRAALVVQQSVAPAPRLDLGQQHGNVAAAVDLAFHEVDGGRDQAAVRAVQYLELIPRIPLSPLLAQPLGRLRIDFDGDRDDLATKAHRGLQRSLGHTTDRDDRNYDHAPRGGSGHRLARYLAKSQLFARVLVVPFDAVHPARRARVLETSAARRLQ
jgi:hypothetical protein